MFYFMIGNDFLVHSSGHLLSTDEEVYALEIQAHIEHAYVLYCGVPATVMIYFEEDVAQDLSKPPTLPPIWQTSGTLVLPPAVDADFAHVD
jgi:hypothetical protein